MRILNTLIITSITMMVFSCNKPNDVIQDNIIFYQINKTVTTSHPDSIDGTCKDLIFKVQVLNQSDNTAIISLNNEKISCDGFNNILADSNTGKVLILNENQKIYENGDWKSANGICLDEFAGKGEKFIGYRSGFYPSGVTNYNYGWIKIELSSDKKTLKIIERATNITENKPINAGQME